MLEKVRRGHRDVEISIRDLRHLKGQMPVLIGDIISSGRTMLEAVRLIVMQDASGLYRRAWLVGQSL